MKKHKTVLLHEAVEGLALTPTSIVVDATLGSGGHAQEICSNIPNGTFIGIDADAEAVRRAEDTITCSGTTTLVVGNFRSVDSIVEQQNVEHVDAILADLGWRMEQFSGNGKGFSFQVDEPLIMTYGDSSDYSFTARDILNEWDEKDIHNVLKGYGEERFARRVAARIAEARTEKPIETTFDLVEIVQSAVPTFYLHRRTHPATKTFQALRIAVNDEFSALEEFIQKSIALLQTGGRLAIITFHSIEDRIVKHLFKSYVHDQHGVLVTKKPITPSEEELTDNPRSRSAKLRIFEKS